MKAEEIAKALDLHKKWLQGKEDGVRLNWSHADLRYADLSNADLRYADLTHADLRHANLNHADLSNADLRYADLTHADLYYAVLHYVDLYYADLSHADLTHADLSHANLSHANLRSTDLVNANLNHADLRYADLYHAVLSIADLTHADLYYAVLCHAVLSNADLRYADLYYADLSNADLSNANLSNAKNVPYIPMYLPEESFIAYKKIKDNQRNEYIVKLRILTISKRSRATGNKCRCDIAKVEEIQDMDGNKLDIAEVKHYGYKQITYKVGELVKADGWNDNRFVDCTNGIHFFVDRQSAVNYNL